MKQLISSVLALIPSGSMLASIQRYQDSIFRETENPSVIGLLPVMPLRVYRSSLYPPDELRLNEALCFSHPREHLGNWYLPLVNVDAVFSIQEKLPPEDHPQDEHENLLFPVFPGIFLCRGGGIPLPSADFPEQNQLRSASFSAALIEYRCSGPRDTWWDSIEETVLWERPVRKPQKNTSSPSIRSTQ